MPLRLLTFSITVLSILLLLQPALAQKQAPKPPTYTRADTLLGALRPERTCYNALHYDLAVTLKPDTAYIWGQNTITLKLLSKQPRLQLDLDGRLQISELSWQGQPLPHTREERAVWVSIPKEWRTGQTYKITVAWQGKPRLAAKPPWDGGYVRRQDDRGRPFLGVACQGDGASLWYPCKDHPSDRADSARISISVPDSLVAVGNGRLVDSLPNPQQPGYRAWRWRVTYPINTYNLSFYVGKLVPIKDTLRQANGRVLDLHYWVLDYNRKWALRHFQQVKPILRAYEQFLAPYPFIRDSYKLVEAPYWGMEHQSAVAYGNHYQNSMRGYDFIIAHETAHEWWGNSITAHDPADMWIQESFTTYMEGLFLEKMRGLDTMQSWINYQRGHITGRFPMVSPEGVHAGHDDADIYYRGAWMLHSLRRWVNDDARFLAALKDCYQHFAGQIISTKQITAWWQQRLKMDLSAFFATYLHQAALPRLHYYQTKGQLHYKLSACHDKFTIPVRFVDQHGQLIKQVQATTVWQQAPAEAVAQPDLRQVLLVPVQGPPAKP